MFEQFLAVFIVGLLAFSVVFVGAVLQRNNSIVDAFWGVGCMTLTIFSFVTFSGRDIYQWLATGFVAVWGLRLCARIVLRNSGKPEDWRYAQWRRTWPRHWFYVRSYVEIFLFQAMLCFVVVLPAIFINVHTGAMRMPAVFAVGIVVWLIGFCFEVVGDAQLDAFIKHRPAKDAVLTSGLWRFSRHPNYFGEATQWWGIWLLAIGVSAAGWWTILGPLVITFLLLKVSGVPPVERHLGKNPKYRAYMVVTNKFIPGAKRAR